MGFLVFGWFSCSDLAFGVLEGGFGGNWRWSLLMIESCRRGGSMVVDAIVYDISEDLSGCIIRWCL